MLTSTQAYVETRQTESGVSNRLAKGGDTRPRLLLMAYECMPNKGSEAYVGWGRVLQAAREFDLDVIVSGESYAAIGEYLKTNTLPGRIRFHTPEEDAKYRLLKRIPRLFAYNYVAYHQWQKLAFKLAKELHRKLPFALVHQVNVCTFREPGYAWRLGIPFVWGPTGGTQNFPTAFFAGLETGERFKEYGRNLSNWLSLRMKRRVHVAAKEAAVVLAANSTNQRDLQKIFRRPVELLLETGLYSVCPPDAEKYKKPGSLRLLWSGEFTTRKALPLLIEALSQLDEELGFELRVLGKGPREAEWKRLVRELGLEHRVHFIGHLPLDDAIAQFKWAHLFVFTSLRDTSGNVVLEAMSNGVPVICFDHQGAGDMVTAASGLKIPVTAPREAVPAIARAIRSMAEDRGMLQHLSNGALVRAREYLWTKNGDRVNSIYWSLIGARQPRNND
jgi:glycosyltransferase involved in cell wall biosynthesis